MLEVHELVDSKNIDVVIYHHPCVDGYSAAFVAKLNIPNIKLIPKKINNTPINYDDIKGKNVLMVDIVTDDFEEIKSHAKNLIILDHHVSNQKKLLGIPYAYFDMKKSGVGLAWEYFFKTDEKMPLFLKAVQDRDLWTWVHPESRNFTDGLYEEVNLDDLSFSLYTNLMDEFLEKNDERPLFMKYYTLGETLNRIKQKNMESIVKNPNNRYETIINGYIYKIYIYNITGNIVSDLGNYVISNMECDFVVLWNYSHNDELYKYSLRSNDKKADVSEISKLYGGGGHRNAAGLSSELHPKDLFKYHKI